MASHDEITAVIYVKANTPQSQITNIRVTPYLKYPHVLFHLLYCKTGLQVFNFLSGIWIYYGVKTKEKASNGLWDTDSELLALLKLETCHLLFNSPVFLEDKIRAAIKKNWGENFGKALIDEMLWYAPRHPLRQLFLENENAEIINRESISE